MKYFIPLFILLLLPNIANARRWYNVEVIIFANTSDAGVQEEHWPPEPGEPDVLRLDGRDDQAREHQHQSRHRRWVA